MKILLCLEKGSGFTATLRHTLSMIVLVVCSLVSKGQITPSNGIFLNAADFRNNIISYPSGNTNDITTTFSDELLVLKKGIVVSGFKPEEIFGYIKNGTRYRSVSRSGLFSNIQRGYYQVEEQSHLIIYSRIINGYKSGRHRWYYYSTSIDGEIKQITFDNLKSDFSDCPLFLQAVKGKVRHHKLIAKVDGKFLINQLYEKFLPASHM